MKVNGQLQIPALYPQRRGPPHLLNRGAWWAPEQIWTLWRRNKPLAFVENRTHVISQSCHFIWYVKKWRKRDGTDAWCCFALKPCAVRTPMCTNAPPNVTWRKWYTGTAICATENEVGAFGVSFAREMSLCMQFHFLTLAHATTVSYEKERRERQRKEVDSAQILNGALYTGTTRSHYK
jgi:hypothetical protein